MPNALGSPAPTKAGRGPGHPPEADASPAPAKRRGKRAKRTPEVVAKMGEAVVAHVAKHPRVSVKQIGKALGPATKELQLPIVRMIEAKKLRTTGERYESGGSIPAKLAQARRRGVSSLARGSPRPGRELSDVGGLGRG